MPLESESIAENSWLKGSLFEVVEETEVVDEVAELAVEAVDDEEASDCCCICINTPRIMLERLAVLLPVRLPSVAAVVLEVLLADWLELEVVELVEDAEVDSSRDRRLASIWDAFPLDEPIPAMDMVVLLLTGSAIGRAIQQEQVTCQYGPGKKAECGVTQLSRLHSGDKYCICCRARNILPVHFFPNFLQKQTEQACAPSSGQLRPEGMSRWQCRLSIRSVFAANGHLGWLPRSVASL